MTRALLLVLGLTATTTLLIAGLLVAVLAAGAEATYPKGYTPERPDSFMPDVPGFEPDRPQAPSQGVRQATILEAITTLQDKTGEARTRQIRVWLYLGWINHEEASELLLGWPEGITLDRPAHTGLPEGLEAYAAKQAQDPFPDTLAEQRPPVGLWLDVGVAAWTVAVVALFGVAFTVLFYRLGLGELPGVRLAPAEARALELQELLNEPGGPGLAAVGGEIEISKGRTGMTMTTKILGAVVLLLGLLFVAPVVYRTGQLVSLYLVCSGTPTTEDPDGSKGCWRLASLAALHGGKLPPQGRRGR